MMADLVNDSTLIPNVKMMLLKWNQLIMENLLHLTSSLKFSNMNYHFSNIIFFYFL